MTEDGGRSFARPERSRESHSSGRSQKDRSAPLPGQLHLWDHAPVQARRAIAESLRPAGNALVARLVAGDGPVVQRTRVEDRTNVERHQKNVATVERVCREAETGNTTDEYARRLKNSVELASAGDIPLWTLTLVDDTDPVLWLATRLGADVGEYNDDKVTDDVVRTGTDKKPGVFGEYTGDAVRLYFRWAHREDEDIRGTLRHEYQHATDFHDALDTGSGLRMWTLYITELRAHWVQDGTSFPGSEGDKITKDLYGHRCTLSERHMQIAERLFRPGGDYQDLADAWISNGHFRRAVTAQGNPTFLNKDNDPELFRRYASFLFGSVHNLTVRELSADDPRDELWKYWLKFGPAMEQAKQALNSEQKAEFEERRKGSEPFRKALMESTKFLNGGWQIVKDSADLYPLPDMPQDFKEMRLFEELDTTKYDYERDFTAWSAQFRRQ